ncbi:jg21166 [Pararge aegeria aegeria]|uniref:Jg21166 protein n=1 Tax=Pararge aegeria aegeria TaxID=348720 RepID=A0A8S4SMK9_9NEOP|nr:jg21166 [Pararge aegeria aegeria]
MGRKVLLSLAPNDGKRPDGMTLIPWRLGMSLVWDACRYPSCITHPGHLVNGGCGYYSAEQVKRRKYENLDSSFIFVPFGVETLGPRCPEARALFEEISKRVIEYTGYLILSGQLPWPTN